MMIVGRLGNQEICSASYDQIANTDFTQYRQNQKQGQQSMERSKLLFGMSDPIDLVTVQIQTPSFRGNEQNAQVNQLRFDRNYLEDIQNYQIVSVSELEKIQHKSLSVRNKNSNQQYDDDKVKIKMTASIKQ